MTQKKNQLAIKSIKVEKLFGYYTYAIPKEESIEISKLLILYGDNGSGKTTILKLLFWLLSSRDRSGYKTKIAETKFKKISITFENGVEIGASRIGNKLIGGFTYYVSQHSKSLIRLPLKTTPENAIRIEDGTKADQIFKKLMKFIKDLNISVFYLSDDRKILNSITSSEHEPESYGRIILNDSDIILSKDYEKVGIKRMLDEKKLAIEPAIERLIDWIRTKTITGSRTGEKNSQVIFTDLIKNIFKSNVTDQVIRTKDDILNEIQVIENSITPYISLGLIDEFDSKTIKTAVNKVKKEEQLNYLITIISPYIESINAKLKALERLKDTLNLFINSVNEYFSNKNLSFHLTTGFSLAQKGGDPISFNLLSSGEKQLLLLFINTITSADQATVFIIDEPEISLNIKWQRSLIDTLLKFSIDKNIQYIISTHSLELLSSNLDTVTKLENSNG